MTWSIVARDASTGAMGIAVSTCFFAVGAICPHGRSGMGALSTQAMTNPLYGPKGLALLDAGKSAEDVVWTLTAEDDGRAKRQLHVVDGQGRTAGHTGAECIDWCGHILADGVSVAGNMLAGPEVIERTMETYAAGLELPFGERLLKALHAGEAAGGDKRGKQSAALKIYTDQIYPLLDIRVDDHVDPLQELARLYVLAQERYRGFASCFATADDPAGVFDRAEVERCIERLAADPHAAPWRGL